MLSPKRARRSGCHPKPLVCPYFIRGAHETSIAQLGWGDVTAVCAVTHRGARSRVTWVGEVGSESAPRGYPGRRGWASLGAEAKPGGRWRDPASVPAGGAASVYVRGHRVGSGLGRVWHDVTGGQEDGPLSARHVPEASFPFSQGFPTESRGLGGPRDCPVPPVIPLGPRKPAWDPASQLEPWVEKLPAACGSRLAHGCSSGRGDLTSEGGRPACVTSGPGPVGPGIPLRVPLAAEATRVAEFQFLGKARRSQICAPGSGREPGFQVPGSWGLVFSYVVNPHRPHDTVPWARSQGRNPFCGGSEGQSCTTRVWPPRCLRARCTWPPSRCAARPGRWPRETRSMSSWRRLSQGPGSCGCDPT